mmetsp:Transcript_1939/g.2218  ORF Transcript_1939/g.2218 Transcript_1939/m.2218 type:complete len:348 (-) Transcript_1939:664-1707(-)
MHCRKSIEEDIKSQSCSSFGSSNDTDITIGFDIDDARGSFLDGSWEVNDFFDVVYLSKPKGAAGSVGEMENLEDGSFSQYPNPPPYSDFDASADEEVERVDTVTNDARRLTNLHEVFLFHFGAVVLWNVDSEAEEKELLDSLRPYMRRVFQDMDLVESASDNMDFMYSKKSSIRHDVVRLSTTDPQEKLAVSYAFAQSNLLSVYEWRLDKIIEDNEHIPQQLARFGKISMSQEDVSKQIGRLFMERNSINLESDILDTPPFFWENDRWDPLYTTICNYLEHDARVDILNKRLDCVHELLEVLTSQAENQHASRLEWIVIWLVASEVFIALFWNILIKDILGYFPECR